MFALDFYSEMPHISIATADIRKIIRKIVSLKPVKLITLSRYPQYHPPLRMNTALSGDPWHVQCHLLMENADGFEVHKDRERVGSAGRVVTENLLHPPT